jgi:exopolyphosphatase/guanosine-5'-triphosphate,3'-diphosphate pyrophosphatase
MDVGGGSTEFVVARDGRVESKVSVKLGSVRLHERCFRSDPPSRGEIERATNAIDEQLGALTLPREVPLVGIAGTVTTLAAMHLGVDPYDPERVHGVPLTREACSAQIARLSTLPLEARKRIAGLEPARADVILAGALIVERALARTAETELIVSDRGVRWGLLYEKLP